MRKNTIRHMRQRINYYKDKGYDSNVSMILGTAPKYVVEEFRAVRKLHGKKYASKWVKGKYPQYYKTK